VYFYYLGVIMC